MGGSVPTPWGPRPADWPLVRWGSFASRAGVPVRVDNRAREKQVTVRVRHQGVLERRINPHRNQQIQTLNQFRIRSGQFIISKIDARNGACGFVPPELDGAIVTQDFPVYEVRDADPRYLDHLVALPVFWRLCESVSDGTTNRVRLDLDQFEDLRFPLPPLAEQRGIAGVLDAMDERIEQTDTVIAATKGLRKALLNDLLTRGLPGLHTEWKHVPDLDMIPACWDVVTLEEVAHIQSGRAVNKARTGECQLPYLTVANVKDGHLDLSKVKTMAISQEELPRYRLEIGDVLLTEGGDADKLGRGTIWRGEIEPCLHQNHVFAVRAKRERLVPDFLAAYVASDRARRYFLGASKQTTNLASLNSTQLRQLPLPLPGLAEQKAIANLLASSALAQSSTAEALEALRALKKTMADELLSGQLRVALGEASHG